MMQDPLTAETAHDRIQVRELLGQGHDPIAIAEMMGWQRVLRVFCAVVADQNNLMREHGPLVEQLTTALEHQLDVNAELQALNDRLTGRRADPPCPSRCSP